MSEILAIVGDNIQTNLTFEQMFEIQKNYKNASLKQTQITGTGTRIGGIYYYIVSEEDRLALSSKLKQHLEIEDSLTTNR